MDDVEHQTGYNTSANRRGCCTERSEAYAVVGPFPPVRSKIGISSPCIQMRRIKHQHVQRCRVRSEYRGRPPKQVGELVDGDRVRQGGHDGRIPGDHCGHFYAQGDAGMSARHDGLPPCRDGLPPRRDGIPPRRGA